MKLSTDSFDNAIPSAILSFAWKSKDAQVTAELITG